MNQLKLDFHKDMINIYRTAEKEIGYKASRFIQMVSEVGGYKTAQQLITKEGGTEGFEILWEGKRLDLSVEALVISEKYSSLFGDDELDLCRRRLKEYGYTDFEETKNMDTMIEKIDELKDGLIEKIVETPELELLKKEEDHSTCVHVKQSGNCGLIDELKKLKESSKEAIEGIEAFSEFKEYLHVVRDVETELIKKIKKANDDGKAKHLILVCGSVGDGKSHVIAQIKHKYPELIGKYDIHNDATESYDPKRNFKEILDEKFHLFSDSKMEDQEDAKLIVAINLGTLSNFIEDELYARKYSKIKAFVEANKIIEDVIVGEEIDKVIDYVNFSDYSIFSLTSNGPISEFMETLFSRITKESNNNNFYMAYSNNCIKDCEFSEVCPLKLNYEVLSNVIIQNEVIQLVIEAIIKHKNILSVRALLDFIYSILVPIEFEKLSDANNLANLAKVHYKEGQFFKLLLPNILFDHKDRTSLFTSLHYIDPMNERLEDIDDLIVKMNIMDEKSQIFESVFINNGYEPFNNLMIALYGNDINDVNVNDLIKLYIRVSRLLNEDLIPKRDIYFSYMQELFNYNTSNYKGMRGIYEDIIESIYKWNGNADNSWINLDDHKLGREFTISQELKIRPDFDLNAMALDYEKLNKFEGNIKLWLKDSNNDKNVKFIVDYDLYELLQKVMRGYKLNNRDKENYIAFIDSLNELLDQGEKQKRVKITHKLATNNINFFLEKDMFGGYTFAKSE